MDLSRFLAAQDPLYPEVLAELRAGQKRTHWMWFVFPQLAGLATSERSIRYAIPSLEAARDYLMHPVLGPRLVQCTELVLTHAGKTVREILGYPDDLKLHSSMTLFARAGDTLEAPTAQHDCFRAALEAFYKGKEDEHTLALLHLS